jgi:hypothetical protein
MPRWLLMAVGLIGVYVATSLSFGVLRSFTQPDVSVTVFVTLDGQPADALIRVLRDDRFLDYEYTDVRTPGEARFTLAGGAYTLQVEHGAGFTSLPKQIELIAEGESVQVDVALERMIEPNDFGYYSADLHVHTVASAEPTLRIFGIPDHGSTPVDQSVGVQLAADLDLMFISDHNTTSSHEVFAATSTMRGVPFVLSEEITTVSWGHYNIYNLTPGELVEFSFAKLPEQYFSESREKGAQLIQINHPYSIAFGYFFSENSSKFDTNFDAVEVFNGPFDDGDFRSVERMFEFWNDGIRHVATAVSDDHDWKIPGSEYGIPRTYVHLDGELTAETFLDRLITGHAFTTYGPMLMLTNADGITPGDSVVPGEVMVNVISVEDLDGSKLELIQNGKVVESVEIEGTEASLSFNIEGEGWVAARLMKNPRHYLALTNPLWIAP